MANLNDPRWQEWTDKFLKSKKSQMTKEVQENLTMCIMAEKSASLMEKFTKGVMEEGMQFGVFKIFAVHGRRIGLKVNSTVMAFICASGIAKNNGTLVMYAHALRRLQQQKGDKVLTIPDLTLGPFAVGFPDETTLQALWVDQKLTADQRISGFADNYLDTVVA